MSKDAVDYILGESKSESDYAKKIVDYAKQVHGDGKVNAILDSSPDEESFVKSVSDLVGKPKETLESKYLEPYVYPAMEKIGDIASGVGTLLKAPIAPAGYLANVASRLAQGKELEDKPVIYENPVDWINAYGSTSALGRTIDTPSLDKSLGSLTEGWKSRDIDLADEFPIATQKIKDITPKQILEGAGDIALMNAGAGAIGKAASSNVAQKAIVEASNKIADSSIPYVKKALIRFSNLPIDEVAEMNSRGSFDKMAMTLNEYGLSKYISDPANLLARLTGETKVTRPKGVTQEFKIPGFIDDFAKDTVYEASQVPETFSLKEVRTNAIADINKKYNAPNSTVTVDMPDLISKMDDMLKLEARGTDAIDLKNLLDFKRKMADYIYKLKPGVSTETVIGANEKALREALWKATDNHIKTKLELSSASNPEIAWKNDAFLKQNERLSDLLGVRNNLNNSMINKINTPSLSETAFGAAVTGAAGIMSGFNPAVSVAAYPAARYAMKGVQSGLPSMIGSGMNSLAGSIAEVSESGLPMQGSIAAQRMVSTGTSLNKMLSEYKLPRSYDEFKAQSKLVHEKLKMEMGEEAGNIAFNQMIGSPQEFQDQMPLKEAALPQLFKYDRYRRINGRIFDPILKKLAEQEILTSPASNTEKMMAQNQLLKNGIYNGI